MKLNIRIKHLLVVTMACLVWSSCKKDSPYRDYQNEITEFNGNVVQYLETQQTTFSSLLMVLNRTPDLKTALSDSKVTLFAPTNDNFAAALYELNQVRTEQGKAAVTLENADLTELEIMMDKYIIAGRNTTDFYRPFLDGSYASSIKFKYQMHIQYQKQNASGYQGGGPVSVTFSDPKNLTVKTNWQRTVTNAVNIKTSNGIINILSPTHIFGFGDFTTKLNK